MPRAIVDFGDWVKAHVDKLRAATDKVKNISPDVIYGPKREWTVAKLLVLGYWVDIYTKIIGSQIRLDKFDSMYYVDLLAGAGLCSVQREGNAKADIIAGSSVVAATYCYTPFTKYILVEKRPFMAKALESRMKVLASNVDVFVEDCNDSINSVVSNFGRKGHYLAFVDNEGCDAKWSTIQTLIQHYGDVWITFQTSEVARAIETGAYREFMGLNQHEPPPPDPLSYYVRKLEAARRLVKVIHVPGIGGFSYDLVLATNMTRAGSPWLDSLDKLKENVEKLEVDFIRSTLDQLAGRQTNLRSFA